VKHAIVIYALLAALVIESSAARIDSGAPGSAQVPTWSQGDLDFFLHGSMSTEVIPEAVLRAFIKTYPDLFPSADLSHLGLIPDPKFGWPIGFSRSAVKHLGGLPSIGVNCASCHVAQVTASTGGDPVRILGATSHFDAEAFFGSVLLATFKTTEAANMKKFLAAYFAAEPQVFESVWKKEEARVVAAIKDDPLGAKGVAPGELHEIANGDVRPSFDPALDLAVRAHVMLQLFHNFRAALHLPDQPPETPPPASGPGRNDAFGLLSAILLNSPQPFAPVKFGLVWNVDQRTWVHWDGNTKSPIARNLLASLGLGAPLHGRQANLQFALVKRQTDLTEKIRPPRYPFVIDEAAAKRGASVFEAKCIACHGGAESDRRLYSVAQVDTDPRRATLFTQAQADGFNKFLAELETAGYEPPRNAGLRSTGKYFAPSLNGVWARSPYLHNGSVRTMKELLTSPNDRAKTFHRGSQRYDAVQMGYTDEGAYVLETSLPGNAKTGHAYGTEVSPSQKAELIEYLKTL
jgi:hypothetical protein